MRDGGDGNVAVAIGTGRIERPTNGAVSDEANVR